MSNPQYKLELVPDCVGHDLPGYIRASAASHQQVPISRWMPPERIDSLYGLSLVSVAQLPGASTGPAGNAEYTLREEGNLNSYYVYSIFEHALAHIVTAPGFRYCGHSGFLLVGTEEE